MKSHGKLCTTAEMDLFGRQNFALSNENYQSIDTCTTQIEIGDKTFESNTHVLMIEELETTLKTKNNKANGEMVKA